MNRSIVCGVDGTQVSRWAARVAGEFARELDRTLVLVHVAEDRPPFPYGDIRGRELARREAIEAVAPMLERTAAAVSDVSTEIRVVFGDPADALIAAAHDADAELLIVGSRGRGPIASVMLGSVSARLATTAPCPVVVVPSPEAADRWLARPSSSRVICAINDSVGSVRALRVAADLAERLELEHSFVHVDTDDRSEDAPFDPPRGALAALMVIGGEPVAALREVTAHADASLLVVGSRGRTSWRAPLGSVSRALAADAPVPVMVVPPTAATRPDREVADADVTHVLRRARRWAVSPVEDIAMGDGRFKALRNRQEGRFSTGIEQRPETAATRRVGSFADSYDAVS